MNQALGQRIRTVRERRALTQEEAAAELGVALRSFQHYEADAVTPRPVRRREILAWLAKHEEVAAA